MGKMARLELHTTDGALDILRLVFVLQTVRFCLPCICVAESHNQAFIQTDKHLTYIDGDLNAVPLKINPGNLFFPESLQDDNFYSSSIRLDPPMLDFEEQPVGMPRMEKVTVQNTNTKNSLHLLSISGSTVHFHCSFFQDKTVPPGGNTTFDVVFLARQVGNVENTLYIHTSIGSVRYQVFGVGVPNPYRLRPYLGARMPINNSFSPVIQMHNPFSSKIQVLEMFSSEGDLHLELPSGEREATGELWEIKPYETKSVMKANFVGRVESNHTAYIRIKTDQDSSEQLLILPVEVEFTSEPGIYSPVELLDFGILRTLDDPKTLHLNLINTGVKAAHITSVSVSPPNDAISIDFRPLKLHPDSSRQYTVAHITFRASKALHPKQWSGKIVVKTKNNQQKLIIPYQANVLHGSLVYVANTTYFFSGKVLRNITRPLTITNTFNFSVVIFNISLPPEAAQFFSVINFSGPVIVEPQETMIPLLLLFHPNATQMHLSTTLVLHTNASSFTIPIIVYSGLIKVIPHRPEKSQGQVDFGTMGVGETRSMIFTVRNDNPVDLVIARFETNMSWATVQLLGVEKGNGTTLTRIHNTSAIDIDPLIIKPFHYAVFSLNVLAPSKEGAYAAEVWMFTQFEDLFIPITFRTAEGSLHAIPEKFVFDKVFPGRVPYKVLQIHSTFRNCMEVTQISFQPQNVPFFFVPHNSSKVILQPQETTVVGKIYFDAKKDCIDDCYAGLQTNTPAGHQWLLGLLLGKDVADTDQYLFTKLQQKWHRLERAGQNTANVTIELDTNQVRGFLFSAQAHLHWPSLVRKSKIKFPLTQIGNITITDFIVENYADVPVVVQVLPLSLYPNPGTIIDLISHGLSSDLTEFLETEDFDTFHLYDLDYTQPGSASPGTTSPIWDHRKRVENSLGVTPHRQSVTALLQPGGKLKVKVSFQPRDDILRSSLILVRNNLTVMDTVLVAGQGCYGEMKFSNRKPGSSSPLSFQMTEKHLKNCDLTDKKAIRHYVPHFTVRRQFTLRNTGFLPFFVQGFSISGLPCEGFGFKVLNCDGFDMMPNTSRKIDIAFTPDFTMSRIQRVLTVFTSLGPPSNYTLQATVPPHLLSRCSSALPRPQWEPILYYTIVCVMGLLFIGLCLSAYFEADRLFIADILRRKLKIASSTQTFDRSKVFDLRTVAAGLNPGRTQISQVATNAGLGSTSPDLLTEMKSMLQANGHVEYHPAQTNGHRHLLVRVLGTIRYLNPRQLLFRPSLKVFQLFATEKGAEGAKNGSPGRGTLVHPDGGSKGTERHLSSGSQHLSHNAQEAEPSADKATCNHAAKPAVTKRNKPNRRLLVETLGSLPGGPSAADDAVDYHKLASSSEAGGDKKGTETEEDPRDRSTASDAADDEDAGPKVDNSGLVKVTSKPRNQKVRGKSRAERNLMKDRVLRLENSTNDDETSSTTTDSSAGGEHEEKNTGMRESTPEPYIPVHGGSRKNKKKPERAVAAVFNGEVNEDDTFELTSKSRAHRKIRVNGKVFGGDIMRPSTLELDYTLPKEKEKNAIVDQPRRNKKQRTQQKSDLLLRPANADESDRDSPPPAWDQPLSVSPIPDDLSELSMQTEAFAKQTLATGEAAGGCLGGYGIRTSLSPDPLSSSSRSSSYSSIVSAAGGSFAPPPGLGVNAPPPGLPPPMIPRVQTAVMSDGGRMQPAYLPYVDPAIIGMPLPKTPPGQLCGRPIRWAGMPNPGVASGLGGGFGLQPVEEQVATSAFFGLQPATVDSFGKPDPYFGMTGEGYLPYPDGSEQNLTMMQQLQAERRQRFLQFQKRKQEEWPGFDVPPIRNDSLWDTDYNPLEPHQSWNAPMEAPAVSATNSFWSTLTNSASSGWNSLQTLANIWSPSSTPTTTAAPSSTMPSQLTSTPVNSVVSSNLRPDAPPFTTSESQLGYVSTAAVSAAAISSGTVNDQPQPQACSSSPFSPFSISAPMADIWKPASSAGSTDSTWGQFLPTTSVNKENK